MTSRAARVSRCAVPASRTPGRAGAEHGSGSDDDVTRAGDGSGRPPFRFVLVHPVTGLESADLLRVLLSSQRETDVPPRDGRVKDAIPSAPRNPDPCKRMRNEGDPPHQVIEK